MSTIRMSYSISLHLYYFLVHPEFPSWKKYVFLLLHFLVAAAVSSCVFFVDCILQWEIGSDIMYSRMNSKREIIVENGKKANMCWICIAIFRFAYTICHSEEVWCIWRTLGWETMMGGKTAPKIFVLLKRSLAFRFTSLFYFIWVCVCVCVCDS